MANKTITVDINLWKSMCFLIEGLALLGTLRMDHPELHNNVVELAKAIENTKKVN